MFTATLITFLSSTPAALAQEEEEAPEFLLGDLGVRIDFPPGPWAMLKWSDWDFKAAYKTSSSTVLLFAWATPIQVPITGDSSGWGDVYLDKIADLDGASSAIDTTEIVEIGGRAVARVDAKFQFGKGGPSGVLRGATVEVAGQNLHIATVGSNSFRSTVERQLVALVERLDFHTAPHDADFGGTVEAEGISSVLPEGWRAPFESEMAAFGKPLQDIGIDDPTPCWMALRPRAGADPDVMVTCQGGLLLGVVDEHSFASVDPVVREKMFGAQVDVPPAIQVDLSDRVGFAFTPRDGLSVGVVPYDRGVARTWVLGEGDLSADLVSTLEGSTYSGPHPASLVDQASYWVLHRTTSPFVLCPLGGCLCVGLAFGLGAAGLGLRGSRNKYAAFDPD